MPWGQLSLGICTIFCQVCSQAHCHSKCIITKYSSVIKVLFLFASFVFSWLLGSLWKWVYNHLLQLCSLFDSRHLSKVFLINVMKIVPFALSLWCYHPSHLLCTLDLYTTKPFSPSPSLMGFTKNSYMQSVNALTNLLLPAKSVESNILQTHLPHGFNVLHIISSMFSQSFLGYLYSSSMVPIPHKFPMHKRSGGFPLLWIS